MTACPKSSSQNRKRQHAEADLSQDDLSSPPSKKFKSTRDHHLASNFTPAFWDSLSKVWLTRRALRELDRRNQLKNSVGARAPAHNAIRQFSNRIDLQRFARLGGPELSDLRGYPEPTHVNLAHTMSSKRSSHSSRSTHSGQSKSTKSTSNSTSKTSNREGSRRSSSAYDADFEQHLVDHGIYMNNRKSKPSNITEIRQRLARPRPSLSPSRFSEGAFEEFQQKNEDVIDEGEVMRDVLPTIYGDADIPHKQDLLFTRLESITDKTTVDAKPDFYDGAPLGSIDKQVREDLSPYIIPTAHRTAPVAPNFFIEAKAPNGGADVAKRQIIHDLALGARGMHQLQSYGADKLVFDNNAYTLGATYHNGQLLMYATHVTPSGPGNSPEYHMTQLGGWATTGDPDTYRRGVAALRHGREVTMEWRDEFISAANERATHLHAVPSTLESPNHNGVSDTTDGYPAHKSQTTEDELPTTSFHPVEESDHNDLSDITEESENSVDEPALDTPVNPTPSQKRPSKGLEKTVSKAPCHSSIATSHRKHRSKRFKAQCT